MTIEIDGVVYIVKSRETVAEARERGFPVMADLMEAWGVHAFVEVTHDGWGRPFPVAETIDENGLVQYQFSHVFHANRK